MADTPNKQIEKLSRMKSYTMLCRDFYTGTIRVMTEKYLPKWSGETEGGYEVRKSSTAFVNMFAPIIDGLAGLITKKEPTPTGYDKIDMNNVDLKHHSIASFSKMIVKKALTDGIVFISAETHELKKRAFLKIYNYEDLMSYTFEDGVLKQIVFKDTLEEKDGKFGIKLLERYVVFKVGGGAVWYKSEGSDTITRQETWENSLKEIPVVWVQTGKELTEFEVIPKLYDIANLN